MSVVPPLLSGSLWLLSHFNSPACQSASIASSCSPGVSQHPPMSNMNPPLTKKSNWLSRSDLNDEHLFLTLQCRRPEPPSRLSTHNLRRPSSARSPEMNQCVSA